MPIKWYQWERLINWPHLPPASGCAPLDRHRRLRVNGKVAECRQPENTLRLWSMKRYVDVYSFYNAYRLWAWRRWSKFLQKRQRTVCMLYAVKSVHDVFGSKILGGGPPKLDAENIMPYRPMGDTSRRKFGTILPITDPNEWQRYNSK